MLGEIEAQVEEIVKEKATFERISSIIRRCWKGISLLNMRFER